MSKYLKEIEALNTKRNALFDEYEGLLPEEEKKTDVKIDELASNIMHLIKKYYNKLPFDFIMVQLANLGQCPNLLNDDNGHWAVVADGFQTVVYGEPEDVETQFFIEAEYWKNTPTEALHYYLNNED